MCLGVFLKNKFVIVLINFSLKLIINFIMYFVGLYSTATPGEWCSPRYGEFGPGGAGMTRSLGGESQFDWAWPRRAWMERIGNEENSEYNCENRDIGRTWWMDLGSMATR